MRHRSLLSVLTAIIVAGLATNLLAQRTNNSTSRTKLREIFVPFEDLEVLLEGDLQRVFLTRKQYEDLLRRALRAPDRVAPHPASVLSSAYQIQISDGRATIAADLELEVLGKNLHTVSLPFSGVGIRTATLDNQPAAMHRRANEVILFLEGQATKRLKLEMVAPIVTDLAQQTLQVNLPRPPTTTIALSVPGNVEVKSGAKVISRQIDAAGKRTNFVLLPPTGPLNVVMSLNNRMIRKQAVAVARGVVIDQITQTHEQFDATMTLRVLHGIVQHAEIDVPAGYEVLSVESPQVATWSVKDNGQRTIDAVFRSPVRRSATLRILAVRSGPVPADWTFPRLTVRNVKEQTTMIGLFAERRLTTDYLKATHLVPLDMGQLSSAVKLGRNLYGIAAYYAPNSDYALQVGFSAAQQSLYAATKLLLSIAEKEQTLSGGFTVTSEAEKLHQVQFTAPDDWHVTNIRSAAGQPLTFERFAADGTTRYLIRFPKAVAAKLAATVLFEARHTPANWFGDWRKRQVRFPNIKLLNVANNVGAVAALAKDDFTLRPTAINNLTPLLDREKSRYGLNSAGALAYRFDQPAYQAEFTVERRQPWTTAHTYTFADISAQLLKVHYELSFDIQRARTRTLSFRLPKSTPKSITVRGAGGSSVKEYTSVERDNYREWTCVLSGPVMGHVRLAADFSAPLDKNVTELTVPAITPLSIAYQSGVIAVEGSPELEIEVAAKARLVDVGELATPDYQIGRYLLASYGFAGSFPEVKATIKKRPGYELPTAIVEQARLVTLLSSGGVSQTAVFFDLRSKTSYLELQLPKSSKLWSVMLNDQPTTAQKDRGRILINLPTGGSRAKLHIVYESPTDSFAMRGKVSAAAPKLLLRETTTGDKAKPGQGREVPIVDLRWQVLLPPGYELSKLAGSVFVRKMPPRKKPLQTALAALYDAGGGYDPHRMYNLQPRLAQTFSKVDGVKSKKASPSGLGDRRDGQPLGGNWNRDQGIMDDAEAEKPSDMPASRDAASPAEKSLDDLKKERSAFNAARMARANDKISDMADYESKMKKSMRPRNQSLVDRKTSILESPGSGPDSKRVQAVARQQQLESWALAGLRSLNVDLEQTLGNARPIQIVSLQSLGSDPQWTATLVNRHRLDSLAWGMAALIILLGLAQTRSSARSKTAYVVLIMIAAATLPLTGALTEYQDTFDLALLAAGILIPYYLLVHLLGGAISRFRHRRRAIATTAVLILVCLGMSTAADAQQPRSKQSNSTPQTGRRRQDSEDDKLPPVKIPRDAVVIPYNLQSVDGQVPKTEKVLVPYERYLELWKLAYPAKKRAGEGLPSEYALSAGQFRAKLNGAGYLELKGTLFVDVFTEQRIAIPIPLQGGVLSQATLDGKPARLQIPSPATPPRTKAKKTQRQVQQERSKAQIAGKEPFALLHTQGKGRKKLDVVIRLTVERQGGWRIVRGLLPAAAATRLSLEVPLASTVVRLTGVRDKTTFESRQANEVIETALIPHQPIQIQWRPKVSEGQTDQSLTADSVAVIDVQEQGLRIAWALTARFRRGERSLFDITIPTGYLVESVTGSNVRGWDLRNVNGHQRLTVTLLKAARQQADMTLIMSRQIQLGRDKQQISIANVSVEGAALQKGRLKIRRNATLELRTTNSRQLRRADNVHTRLQMLAKLLSDESPLQPVDYQSFRFDSAGYALQLEVSPVTDNRAAEIQSLVRASTTETRLETRVQVKPGQRPIYEVQLAVPKTLKLEELDAPGRFHWSLSDDKANPASKILRVFLGQGQATPFTIQVAGSLGASLQSQSLEIPRLSTVGISQLTGYVVVQVDPAYDVTLAEHQNCETVLKQRVFSWLQPKQRSLARLALRYTRPDYAAKVKISPKKAIVNGSSISNVKLTTRAIVETMLLEFNGRDAGIREVVFQIPANMREASIQVPWLRQKIIENVDGRDDVIRVRLKLQDDIMGQLFVLVENRRPLTSEAESAPIPKLETGTVGRQYVTLENTGRDEVVVGDSNGVRLLGRSQSEFQTLSRKLSSDRISQAYLVSSNEANPHLHYRAKQRELVKTAGASIRMAEARIVLDGSGVYRASQIYRIDNETEQHLEINLPDSARLWTVMVAGTAAKPSAVGATDRRVRIPLSKTAAGDNDYTIVINYGGSLGSIREFSRVSFPLVKTVNINVEQSHVRLHLPKSHRWIRFNGTMSAVKTQDVLLLDTSDYQKQKIQRQVELAGRAGQFAKARQQVSLSQLKREQAEQVRAAARYSHNADLQTQVRDNDKAIRQLESTLNASAAKATASVDNPSRLNQIWRAQKNAKSNNVVTQLDRNFGTAEVSKGEKKDQKPAAPAQNFDNWLKRNQLNRGRKAKGKPGESGRGLPDDDAQEEAGKGKDGGRSFGKLLKSNPLFRSGGEQQAKPSGRKSGSQQSDGKQPGQDGEQSLKHYREQLRQRTRQSSGSDLYQQQNFDAAGTTVDKFRDLTVSRRRRGESARLNAGLQVEAAARRFSPQSLASLDVISFPERGQEFYFRAPRGKIELTAQAISEPLVNRLLRAVALLIGLIGAVIVIRFGRLITSSRALSVLLAILIIIAGGGLIVRGFLPLLGILTITAGLLFAFRRPRDTGIPAGDA